MLVSVNDVLTPCLACNSLAEWLDGIGCRRWSDEDDTVEAGGVVVVNEGALRAGLQFYVLEPNELSTIETVVIVRVEVPVGEVGADSTSQRSVLSRNVYGVVPLRYLLKASTPFSIYGGLISCS